MHDRVGIGGIRLEVLPHHPPRLAMRVLSRSLPLNLGRKLQITCDLLPGELKRIDLPPDIRPAAGHAVLPLARIEFGFTW